MAKRDAAPPQTATDQINRDLARRALEKQRRGEAPTAQELAALKRVEKAREEELRWQYYRTIPQRHWREMSGRQAKILIEQADRYGIPFGGKTVDLPAVVKALHDFLAANKTKLSTPDEDELPPLKESEKLAAVRRQREEIRLQVDRGKYVSRENVRRCFSEIASILRRAGEQLQRRHGNEAYLILHDALDAAEHAVIQGLAHVGDNSA